MQKFSENKHVEAVGLDYFQNVKNRALLRIKQDNRLIGLDRIRDEIAQEAAIRATGGPARAMVLSRRCGELTAAMQDICDELVTAATEAAREVSRMPTAAGTDARR